MKHILDSLIEARTALDRLLENETALSQVSAAASLLIRTIETGGRIYSCGNGGSMCDAMHFAEELTGRYRKDRRGFPALAISDAGHLTCVGNDYGYEHVFARFIESHARPGDCLVALSTSGTSQNVVKAIEAAGKAKTSTILLTGRAGSTAESMADITICTPAGAFADRVQELHIKILHILIESIERHFCPECY